MKSLTALASLLLAGCGGSGERPPNVLLISLDTLRADRLGCYGSPRGLTPNLDALAAGATRWTRCTASAPWTVPSHASMFTGRWPHAHGAHSFEAERLDVDHVYVLEGEHLTLAEVLAGAGYRTAAFVANVVYLKPAFGLAQGFDSWTLAREPGADLGREVLDWIDEHGDAHGDAHGDERPWFLFVNYMDAHRPYNVAALDGEREYGADEFSSVLLDRLYRRVLIQGRPPGELGEQVEEQYDRGVRNLDRALGELFAALRQRGLWDDTLIVVTADHGEYFGEHGLVEHSKDVYQEALEVPLIVKRSGQIEGRQETPRASVAHVPRLILDGLGGAILERHTRDFPLSPGEGALVLAENYYSRPWDVLQPTVGQRFRRVRSAIFDGDFKLIRSSSGDVELYHLGDDPGEAENLAQRMPEQVERMASALTRMLETDRWTATRPSPIRVDDQRLELLREQGYVGGDEEEDGR